MLLRRLVPLLLAALAALAPLAASPPVEADEPSHIVRSLEDSLGSPSHIVRSLEDSLGSPSLAWPDRRFAPCGAIDPDADVLYAFGGRADDGTTHHGDLWALDLAADEPGERPAWQQAAPAGAPAAPPPVRSCAAAWEPGSDRLLVFGGWNGATHDGALRAFDPQTGAWQVLCDATSCGAGPSPRRAAQLVVDPLGQRVVLVGGTNGTVLRRPVVTDLTNLDVAAGHDAGPDRPRRPLDGPRSRRRRRLAVRRHPTRAGPRRPLAPRPGHDDLDGGRRDVRHGLPEPTFGGHARRRPGRRPPRPVRRLGVGAERLPPRRVDPRRPRRDADLDAREPASERPQARFFHVAGYDPATRAMVVFGGGANGSAYKDAVALTLPIGHRPAAWHSIAPTTPLTSRDQVAVVLDGGVLTAFGGFGSGTLPGSDHGRHAPRRHVAAGDRPSWWLAPGDTGDARTCRSPARARRTPSTPTSTACSCSAGSPATRRSPTCGWPTSRGPAGHAGSSCAHRRRAAPARRHAGAPTPCTTRAGQRLVVFGGLAAGGVATDDVWALDLTGTPTWQRAASRTDRARPPVGARRTGYDPVGRRLVVFGGQTGPDATGTPLGDTLGVVARRPATLDAARRRAGPRRRPGAARRARSASTTGGPSWSWPWATTASTGQHHGDVWSLDLGADDAAWVQLDTRRRRRRPIGAALGSRRVYDAAADRFLLAFGRDADDVHRRAVVVRPDDPHLVATAWVTVPALARMGGWTSPS